MSLELLGLLLELLLLVLLLLLYVFYYVLTRCTYLGAACGALVCVLRRVVGSLSPGAMQRVNKNENGPENRRKIIPKSTKNRPQIDEKSILGGSGRSGSLRGCSGAPPERPGNAKKRIRERQERSRGRPGASKSAPGTLRASPERFQKAPRTPVEGVRCAARGRKRSWIEILAFSARCADCLLYTSPSPRDGLLSRMPSSA